MDFFAIINISVSIYVMDLTFSVVFLDVLPNGILSQF